MPLLDPAHVQDLLQLAEYHRDCNECGHRTAQDYCRSCDEFYWIHAPGCTMHEVKHYGHRLTVVPFVEDHGGRRPPQPEHENPSCIFFANGVTAVCDLNGQQQPRLQKPWLELFAEFLEMRGEDPAAFRLFLTDGKEARFFRPGDGSGWNWRFL